MNGDDALGARLMRAGVDDHFQQPLLLAFAITKDMDVMVLGDSI